MRRTRAAYASFGLVLEGECWLSVDGHPALRLSVGDFVLLPASRAFTIASDLSAEVVSTDAREAIACSSGNVRYGDSDGEPDFKQLGCYFELHSANRGLLGSLLPTLIHIQASDPAARRLKSTIDTIVEEALADRPGRDLVVDRLIDVLLIEALRFQADGGDSIGHPGLLTGLSDPLLARSLRRIHSDVARAWSVEELAKEAGLSRSAFSERFGQKVGVPPMQYLIEWRMALAKAILQGDPPPLEVVAARIGYQSASSFSSAFRREVGYPPSHFARAANDQSANRRLS